MRAHEVLSIGRMMPIEGGVEGLLSGIGLRARLLVAFRKSDKEAELSLRF